MPDLFLDYPEYHLYSESLLDVGREIDNQGHNLELHIHPEFLPERFFTDAEIKPKYKFDGMSLETAKHVAKHIVELHGRVSSKAPTSFRGGGYRYNENILRALADLGIKLTSNDMAARDVGTRAPEPRAPYRWENDLIEVPVSSLPKFRNLEKIIPSNFNRGVFSNTRFSIEECVERHLECYERYFEYFPDGVAVMVMHSWSFWDMDDEGYRSVARPDALERFDMLLSKASELYDIIGFSDLEKSINADNLPVIKFT